MAQEFILPVTSEEYRQAGSKFITMPLGITELELDIECGMLDWETTGKSLKLPVTVIEEGPNYSRTEKLVFGIDKGGIWKGKEIYHNVTGKEPPSITSPTDGRSHPVFKVEDFLGKPATGFWQLQHGTKGGDPSGEPVVYPKLMSILPPRGASYQPQSRVPATPATSTVSPADAEQVVLQAVIGSTEDEITTRVVRVPQIEALRLSIAGLFRVIDQLVEKGLITKDQSGKYQRVS